MDSRARAATVALFGAAAVFGALASSALGLAMLPAPGFSVDERGLVASLDPTRSAVTIDAARGEAWLVGERAVCAVDLARGEAPGCQELAALREPPRQLAAGRRLLVVYPDPGAPADAVAFGWLALGERGAVLAGGKAGPAFPAAWSRGAALLNLAWDPEGHRGLVAYAREDDQGREVVRVPLDLGEGPLEPSTRPLPGEMPSVQAAFAGEDPPLLLADRSLFLAGRATPLPVPEGACKGRASASCVAVQGSPRAEETPVAALVTAEGKARAGADVVGAVPAGEGEGVVRQRVTCATTADACEPRLATYTSARLTVVWSGAKRATFEVREGGGERVLVGRIEAGSWIRLARGASPIEAWTVLPHDRGALALDGVARRGVVLGPTLRPVDPEPRGVATLADLARERFRSADLDVKLYALALVSFVPLFAVALVLEVKRRRAGAGSSLAVVALGLWAIATVLLLVLRQDALFVR